MSDDRGDALPPDVQAILDAERHAPDPPAEARARVLARLGPVLRAGGASRPLRPVVQWAAAILVTFAVGIATGIGLQVWIFDADPPVQPVPTAAPPPPPAHPRAPVSPAAPPEAPHQLLPEAVPPPRPSPRARDLQEPPERSTLAEENALLKVARMHLEHGEGTAAFDVLARHAREFPRGLLVEEREALMVKALMMSHNRLAAHARADAFRRAFPRSLYRPVVEAALQSP